jgi:hypothetical protein
MTAPAIGPAKLLLIAVYEYLDEHYPHWRVNPQTALPDGLRMEMHPATRMMIMRDEESRHWPMDDLARVFCVPVKIAADLPEGYWRLVVVTEDVLTGGKMPA